MQTPESLRGAWCVHVTAPLPGGRSVLWVPFEASADSEESKRVVI